MHKDYLAERAVELALALNKQRGEWTQEPVKDTDDLLEDAGKILTFMQKGTATDGE